MWSRCLRQLCNDLLNRCILYIMQCDMACRFILPCSQRGDQICYKITILHVSSVHSVCVCVWLSVSRIVTDLRSENKSIYSEWFTEVALDCLFVLFFCTCQSEDAPPLCSALCGPYERDSVWFICGIWNEEGCRGSREVVFIRVSIQLQLLNMCSCSLVSSVGERWSHFPACWWCCRPVRLSRPVRCCLLLPYFVLTFHIPAVTCISS